MVQISEPGEHLKFGQLDASYQAAGGFEGLQRLCHEFYSVMQHESWATPLLQMHPEDLDTSADKLARFLSGWLGGPSLYKEAYGPISIPRAHQHLKIDANLRDTWLQCMTQALEVMDYPNAFKAYLLEQLAIPAERCRHASVAFHQINT